MNAKEAKERSLAAKRAKTENLYAKAKEAIEKAVNLGNFKTWVYGSFPQDVKDRLIKEGYKVGEVQIDREESVTPISWEG